MIPILKKATRHERVAASRRQKEEEYELEAVLLLQELTAFARGVHNQNGKE